jgi:dephospho-CoA kinase
MKRVLITGMSGTGKSTVIQELSARGYRAVDLDQPGWSVHADDGDWIWNEDRVWRLFSEAGDGMLFLSGCAENQVKFHEQFEHIVLLSAPQQVIIDRLATRTNNPYGKDPAELAEVLGYLETIEPRLRRVADYEIDTSVALEEVVEKVLELTNN